MEIFGIPFFDNDFYKMLIKLIINVIFLTGIIRFIYYKYSKKKEYLFTFYLIGTVVFFLCFTLKKYELDLGMALGLFAIFGIKGKLQYDFFFTENPTSSIILSKTATGIPRSRFVSPALGFVQSPIETIGSLNIMTPP